mgnify:CR=1 FL=1
MNYDLHIHSCLSPCGDEEMTPNNIVNMAALCGLDVIALCDHNTCGNCAALLKAAAENHPNMTVLPGMELETAEEVHVLCLFAELSDALAFEKIIKAARAPITNRPDIYGRQVLRGADDEIIGFEPQLLVTATSIPIEDVPALVESHNGAAIPAHVDRGSNSVISNLGFLTPDMGFRTIEFSKKLIGQKIGEFLEKNRLMRYNMLMDSDAHRLEDIGSAGGTTDAAFSSKRQLIQLLLTTGL